MEEKDTNISEKKKKTVMIHRGKQCSRKIMPRFRVMWKITTGCITHAFDSAVGGLQVCPQSPVPPTAWQPWLWFGCHEGARNSINSLSAEKLDRQCQTEAGITSRVCVIWHHCFSKWLTGV